MGVNFTHLSVHSDNSLMMGYGLISEYIEIAKRNGQESLALTDINSMVGIYKFINQCNKNEIKPIPGVVLNLKTTLEDGSTIQGDIEYSLDIPVTLKKSVTRTTLLAKNHTGLINLFKLVKLSYEQDNFYVYPRVDLETLAEYSEGIICLSGDRFGEISCRIRAGQYEKAKEKAAILKSIFKDDFYIELIPIEGEPDRLLENLIKLANELNIKTVVTNDVYYPHKEDAWIQENLIAMGNRNKMTETPIDKGGLRFRYSSSERWMKSSDEILNHIKETIIPNIDETVGVSSALIRKALSDGIKNTQEIVDKIEDIKLEYNNHLRPPVILPEDFKSSYEYIKHLLNEGFKVKRAHQPKEIQEKSKEKVDYELEVLRANDFIDYFITIKDVIDWTRSQGQEVGVGRGCFLPGNMVTIRENRKCPIENIPIGVKVKTHDTTTHTVDKLWEYDVVNEKCIKITLSNGQEITATHDHLIFKKEDGFTKISDLSIGDILLGPKNSREFINLECVYCGKKISTDIKSLNSLLYKNQPYKNIGEYCCTKCTNPRLIQKDSVLEALRKGALRNKDEDVKRKNSESVAKYWRENYDERVSKWHNFLLSEKGLEYKKRLSYKYKKKYSDPIELEKLCKLGNGKCKCGYFSSIRQNKEIYYQSSFELKMLNILETSSDVKSFDRYKGSIQYKDLMNDTRNYLPDFFVEYNNGDKAVIEVKANWQIKESATENKLSQAKEFFKEKNIQFKIITEKELELLNDLRHNEIRVLSKEEFLYTGKVYDLRVQDVHNYIIGGVTVHNSVGGSEIAYLLDISRTDPIRFNTMFERFISPGRGPTYEITYEDGSVETVNIAESKIVNGEKKYIYELSIGDEIEE